MAVFLLDYPPMDKGICSAVFADGGRCALPATSIGGLCAPHRDRKGRGGSIDTPVAVRRKQDPKLVAAGLQRCWKCNKVKPIDEFPKIDERRRRRTCKPCENARLAAARKANPEPFKAAAKRSRDKLIAIDPDGVRARESANSKRWRATHSEIRNDATNAWYAKNPGYARAYHLRTKYGLTPEQHAALLASQDGLCAICRTAEPRGRHGLWQVDHNHITGQRRGLLCHKCNVGVGSLQDSADMLRSAADYLDHWTARRAAVEPPL